MMEYAGLFASDALKSVLDLMMSVSWITVTVEMLLIALAYFFQGYTVLCIGRKLNAKPDWMPFVPIACSIYELHMLREKTWKVFFFKDIGYMLATLLGIIIASLCLALTKSLNVAITMGVLFGLAYAGYSIYITYKWYRKLYKRFDFNPMIAVMHYVPGLNVIVSETIKLLIAYDNGRPLAPFVKKIVDDTTAEETSSVGVVEGLNGMYRGAQFKLTEGESMVCGRDGTQCNLVFDQLNAEISNVHCCITYKGESGYTVTDSSKNGTFIGESRQRLQSGVPVQLPKGTKIYLATENNMFLLN